MNAIAGAVGGPYAEAIEVPYDRVIERPYGWIKLLKVDGLCLIFYITFLSCLAIYLKWDNNSYRDDGDEPDNEVTVTATLGYISISTDTIDNINKHLVTSNSSVPVDLIFQAEDDRVLSTILNVLPSSSFYFESEEPLTITAVAS